MFRRDATDSERRALQRNMKTLQYVNYKYVSY